MPPSIPRPPSYIPSSTSELGSFQQFLEPPKPPRRKKRLLAIREMPTRRQSSPWGQLSWQVVEVFVAETVGTAMMLFFGCMGLVSWSLEGTLPPLQGAIVFAVVVTTIIQLVTPAELASPPGPVGLCCTVPHGHLTDLQALAVEFCATCFLVLVVCSCLDHRNQDKADSTPLKFGCTILALSVAVGPYTGASMNPARSLAPALWTGTWDSHWIYWLGPCLGGFFTAIFYQALFQKQVTNPSHEEVSLHQVKVASQTNQ